jgi:phosphate starvation-inducible PhoH-like protein
MSEIKQKRVPKGEIRFLIHLNEEQKYAKQEILNNTVTILKGSAGSGKSMVAAQVALDLLFKNQIEKIIITRPLVTSGEEIGFLPGGVKEKTDPFSFPIHDNMVRLYNKEKIEKEIAEGRIEMVPLAFMRGRNLTNCCVILDEAQNATMKQTELLLSRICSGSKLIVCGDSAQIDLKDKKQSGFNFICNNLNTVPGISVITLKQNHRDPIVEKIIEIYSQHRD